MLAERGQSVPVSADVDAMRAALMLDVAVVSNSWGYVNAIPVPQALAIAIEEVATKGRGGRGAIVLFAAGNDNRELLANELYSLPFVVTVGGVNPFDEVAAFSNRGTALDLVAPTGTLTTDLVGSAGEDPSDYTSLFGGTSAACPVAAGVAGLVVSVALDAGRSDVESWLIGTTRRAPFARAPTGQDLEYGYGIIDAKAAVERAMGTPPTTDAGTIPLAPDENEPTRGCGCGLSSGCGLWALAVCLRRRHRSA
jgi:subtilisin family serine protease